MTIADLVRPGNAAAWCFASDEPGGPVTIHDLHEYDLRTMQPPPGPVIAGWARRYARNGCFFAVGYTGVGDTIGASMTRWTTAGWLR